MNVKTPFLSKNQATQIAEEYPTPLYIYDEKGIRETARKLYSSFEKIGKGKFLEYFAVKANPTPKILKILAEEGCGFDCATLTELKLIDKIFGENTVPVMYTGNVNPDDDFIYASGMKNAIINLDDITHIDILEKLTGLPETVSFRYNPGKFVLDELNTGGIPLVIGSPADSKYGLTTEQLFEGFKILKEKGVKKFGIHAFLASNTLTNAYYPSLAGMLFETVVEIKNKIGVEISFINLSGGIGIAYHPEEYPNDIDIIGAEVTKKYTEILVKNNLYPDIFTELGRFMLAPHGLLITKAIREKHTHKEYIGVDACASNLMRPAMYNAYHHITVIGKENSPADTKYDVTGGLCENSDKFAIDRLLPKIEMGDILAIHDVGAHGHSMGYNYNGKLRCAEVLLNENLGTELIRRAETPDDYFKTMIF